METETDPDGRTSLPEVFAIGDGARFGGAQAAMAMGTIAASAVAGDLGLRSPSARRAQRRLARSERFQRALWRLFEAAPQQAGAIDANAVVCRCEEVTAGVLRDMVK